MTQRLCIIDLPGLSSALLPHVPKSTALGRWLGGQRIARLTPTWPAVTCSVQASLTTGATPDHHGIVANGMATYRHGPDADLTDPANHVAQRRAVSFWEQSNKLLEAPRFWTGRGIKTALLFFQNSMPGFDASPSPAADIVITPKPEHGPDGKITSLLWTSPPGLQREFFAQLGPFPLMNYWGPMAGIASSRWIAAAAARVWVDHSPTLQLTYVPHLDYDLQRHGPDSPQAAAAVADVSDALDPLINAVLSSGASLLVLSEYAIEAVDRAIAPNVLLDRAGLLATQDSPDGRIVDYAATPAFALCDHQIAHVFIKPGVAADRVRQALDVDGIDIRARAPESSGGLSPVRSPALAHRRAGDLQLTAPPGAWFDYRWWTSPHSAPTFATTVDIHKKPGYDPLELFLDPPARRITQDASRVKGSHGRVPDQSSPPHSGVAFPLLIGDPAAVPEAAAATDLPGIALRIVGSIPRA